MNDAVSKYICPMCPGVKSDGPAACPKCGMALEPTTVSATERIPELADMTRRFWVGAGLTAPAVS